VGGVRESYVSAELDGGAEGVAAGAANRSRRVAENSSCSDFNSRDTAASAAMARNQARERTSTSNIRNRNFVNPVSVCINDADEPAVPVKAPHDGAMLELTCQRRRIITRGGMSRQIDTFVICQDLFAISQMEVVARH